MVNSFHLFFIISFINFFFVKACVVRRLSNDNVCHILTPIFDIISDINSESEELHLAFSILFSLTKDRKFYLIIIFLFINNNSHYFLFIFVAFNRQKLLSLPQMRKLFLGKNNISYKDFSNVLEQIKELSCQMFFTDLIVEENVLSSCPFYGKLPFPTPSGRDNIWDTFFILYFNTPRAENDIYFYVKLSSSSISLLRGCSKKQYLMLDFLDNLSCDTSDCVSSRWNVTLVYDGTVFGTNNGPARTEEDNLWHCSFSLNSPSDTEKMESIPKDGIFVVFHGSNLPPHSWVALGAVTLCDQLEV